MAAARPEQRLCWAVHSRQTKSEPIMSKPWTALRLAVLLAALLGTLFWIGSLVSWWNIPAARRDGLELIGPVLATAYFVLLVLPTLLLALLSRWLVLAAVLGVVVVALASDTLLPWLPWHLLPGPP
jgi:hypothetical protein